jgi:type I restriction enzyme R subunit
MPTPGEHKTVQARILAYAEVIGWTFVSREEAERRRGFDPEVPPADRARNRSLFFDDLLYAKVREFNPRYAEAEGALLGQFRHLHTDIYGNREFPVQRGLNRRERREHKEDFDWSIWPQAVAISTCRQFWDRLFQKGIEPLNSYETDSNST